MSELHDTDRRVAVLEQIARDTASALADIRAELREMRSEMVGLRGDMCSEVQGLRSDMRSEMQGLRGEFQELRRQHHTDMRWLLRLMIGGFVGTWALIAHGLHWLETVEALQVVKTQRHLPRRQPGKRTIPSAQRRHQRRRNRV